MSTALRLLCTWTVALISLPGCSPADDSEEEGADDTSEEAEPSSAPSGALSCDLVSRDQVASTLGLPDLSAPEVDEYESGIQCTYATSDNPVAVIILYYEDQTLTDFAGKRQSFDDSGQATSSVSGFGEAAFASELTQNLGTMGAFSEGYSVCVSGKGNASGRRALMTEILAAL